ncbi:MAG: cadherin domain-containing protein, partial [Hyphomicrobiales bacterium]|nr:cadherin domain-containing protein [Hyphomicrobiales bacterium]
MALEDDKTLTADIEQAIAEAADATKESLTSALTTTTAYQLADQPVQRYDIVNSNLHFGTDPYVTRFEDANVLLTGGDSETDVLTATEPVVEETTENDTTAEGAVAAEDGDPAALLIDPDRLADPGTARPATDGESDPIQIDGVEQQPLTDIVAVDLDLAGTETLIDGDISAGTDPYAPSEVEGTVNTAQSLEQSLYDLYDLSSILGNHRTAYDIGRYVNPAPTSFNVSLRTIPEDALPGTVVATLSASDAGDTLTYSLSGPAAAYFEVVGNEVRLREDAGLDYESDPDLSMIVTVTDSAGNKLTRSVSVEVTDATDYITGTQEIDYLRGTAGRDVIDGLASDDYLDGLSGDDILIGGLGDDTLEGGVGADKMDGGEGSDTISYSGSAGGVTVNLLTGMARDGDAEGDTFANFENIYGSDSDDDLTGDAGENIIDGWGGDDIINGGAGDDILDGGYDDDVLTGGAGDDFITGNFGDDTAVFSGDWSDYTITHVSGNIYELVDNRPGSPDGTDLVVDIETFVFHDRTIHVTEPSDLVNDAPTDIDVDGVLTVHESVVNGGTIGTAYSPGGSVLAALSAVDPDIGDSYSFAIDAVRDADGNPVPVNPFALYQDPDGAVYIGVAPGASIDFEAAAGYLVDVTVTDGAGQSITRTLSIDIADYEGAFLGTDGDDNVVGTSEEDVISTAGGDDFIHGSEGADAIDGGDGLDTVTYSGDSADLVIDLKTGTGSGGTAEGDTYANIERVVGGAGNDTIIADDHDGGYYWGRGGDDTLIGGTGTDSLYGGDGADTLNGGAGEDWARYGDGDQSVTVDLGAPVQSGGMAEGDILIDIENVEGSRGDDRITGDAGDNHLMGGEGADIIDGGAGDDLIQGWGWWNGASVDGDDILSGGTGNDTIEGQAGNDTLTGGSGDDALDGGAGTDTAIYSGNWSDYAITYDASTDTFTLIDKRPGSPDGTDTVTGVELFQFTDRTIAVTDPADLLNDAPTDITVTGGTVSENAVNGTLVATASVVDGDAGDSHTYSLLDDAGGAFAIDAASGEITVADGARIDFEAGPTRDITVRVTDAGGASYDEIVSIAIDDVAENLVLSAGDDVFTDTGVTELSIDGGWGDDIIIGSAGDDVIRG